MTSRSTKLLSFAVGAAAGALAGLLFAPDKGQKTREALLKRARALRGELEKSIEGDFSYFSNYKKSA